MPSSSKLSPSSNRQNTVNGGGSQNGESGQLGSVKTGNKRKDNSGIRHSNVSDGRITYLSKKQVIKNNKQVDNERDEWRKCRICNSVRTFLSKEGFLTHLRVEHGLQGGERCEREAEKAKLRKNGTAERRLVGQAEDLNRDIEVVVEGAVSDGDFQDPEFSLSPPDTVVEPNTENRGNGRYNLRPNRTRHYGFAKVSTPCKIISKKKQPSPSGRGRGRPKKLNGKSQQPKTEKKQKVSEKNQVINKRWRKIEEEVPPPLSPIPSEILMEPTPETQAQGRYNLRPNRARNYIYPASFWSAKKEKPEQEQKKPRGRPRKSPQPTPQPTPQQREVINNTIMDPYNEVEVEVPPRPPKLWCRLCPANIYLDLRDLRWHILKSHKKDPSMVSWFNTCTWGLPIAGLWKPHPAFCDDGDL